VTLKKEQRE